MNSLCTKANRAKYALNNIAKFKRIPVKTAIRLFDATILPILTYGSEIWALNSTLDYDEWDSCPLEKSHLDFIRHILGTNRSVNNPMCRTELGRYPLCIEISCRVVNFYKHMKEMPKDSIVYQTFLIDNSTQGLDAIKTLKQHITNLEYITVPNISNLHKKSIRKELRSHYEIWWRDQIRTSTRGLFFLKFKQNIRYEKYLDQHNQRNLRCSLSKTRLSDHKLMIEQGRKLNLKHPDKNESVCYVMMVQTVRLKMKFTSCLTALGESTNYIEIDLSARLTKLFPFLETWTVTINFCLHQVVRTVIQKQKLQFSLTT